MDKYEIRNLINQLNEYTKLYDEGCPAISDTEWDKMYFELKEAEQNTGIIYPDSPTQSISYEIVSKLRKVEHTRPMLSLDKTKDWNEFLQYFKDKDVVGMCKLDGLTCRLTYEHGYLVGAETRGNGKIGEDILHNAKVIKSIPQKIKYEDRFVVDGEIICTYKDFEQFAEEYKNPRNFASGSIRLLDAGECAKRSLTFVVWNVVEGTPWNSIIDNFTTAESLGFTIVPWTSSFDWDAKEFLVEQAEKLGYPIDGLVGRFDDIVYGNALGETEHHNRAAYAFKFEDDLYDTSLIDIEWSMGRSGILTPVAIFEPVEVDGTQIERASLHNWTVEHETIGTPYRGQKIQVFKSNMIIPQIASGIIKKPTEEEADYIPTPTICPICGGDVSLVESDGGTINLVCSNSQCSGKLINQLDYFVGRKGLDVKGLSVATLEKLIDLGWLNNIADIFNLKEHRAEWIKLPGFGAKSVDNILNNIENKKNVDLATFICSLGIPLIGSTQSKILAKNFNSWNNFRDKVKEGYDFSVLENFGEAKTNALLTYNYDLADEISIMFPIINISIKEDIKLEILQTCDGLNFVITGSVKHYKNRDELTKTIESLGGKVVGSVSKKTNYLINNDSTFSSAKNVSAQKLGIPIITEEEFISKFVVK